MSDTIAQEPTLKQLLDKMVAARQLSSADAETLARQHQAAARHSLPTEAEVLQWLAREYELGYTTLEDVEPDRQLLTARDQRLLERAQIGLDERVGRGILARRRGLVVDDHQPPLAAPAERHRRRQLHIGARIEAIDVELWSRPGLFVLVIGLLGLEWLLRQRSGYL